MTSPYEQLSISAYGRPAVTSWQQRALAPPEANDIAVRHEYVGVDYIDTMIAAGQMPLPLPASLGFCAAGVVEAVGAAVTQFRVGDRVAYMATSGGSYATARVVPAARAVLLPDAISTEIAAAALFKGLTAWYLATRLRTTKPGDIALVHAAAGGVGLLLTQWLKHLGARVVGCVSTPAKAELLRAHGCDEVVVTSTEDFVARVRSLSSELEDFQQGADVVYESVGKATFAKSIEAARRFALIVSYGWPSGDPEPVPLALLRTKSLFVTRPTVSHYTADARDFQTGTAELFRLIGDRHITVRVGARYPLREAATALAALESGNTTGSIVLTCDTPA